MEAYEDDEMWGGVFQGDREGGRGDESHRESAERLP
jgi:hypothetical protein